MHDAHDSRIGRRGLLWLGSALVLGCGTGERRSATSASPRPAPAPRPYGVPQPYGVPSLTSPPGVAPGSCVETAANIEGPYYKPDAPERAVLADGRTPGVPLSVAGRVLGADCRPVPGARLEIWQANSEGAYDNSGFGFRAQLAADRDGLYRFDTVIPGHYLNGRVYRPAHIHVKVHVPNRPVLTTQLYFDGDPYNGIDPFIHPSLVMPLAERYGGGKTASFDFVV
jgi:protocatechuate 3,4-dioxygenase beta subunit